MTTPAEEGPSAHAFGDIILERIAWVVREQLPAIERAGVLIADAIAAGHRVWVTQTSHTLHLEATHRAGGFMAADVLEGVASIERGDVVLLGTSAGTSAGTVDLAITSREHGAVLIAFTQVGFETDPRVGSAHPSGRLLHEVADLVVDLGGPFGDGEFVLPGTAVNILPASGATGVVALWMTFAEAVKRLAEQGHSPLVWQSNLLAGSSERNAELHREYESTRLGYFTSRVR